MFQEERNQWELEREELTADRKVLRRASVQMEEQIKELEERLAKVKMQTPRIVPGKPVPSAADVEANEEQQLMLIATINQLTEALQAERARSVELQKSTSREALEVMLTRSLSKDLLVGGPGAIDKSTCEEAHGEPSRQRLNKSATFGALPSPTVPRLQLPETESASYSHQAGERMSWESVESTSTLESTPSNSIDRPWLVPPSEGSPRASEPGGTICFRIGHPAGSGDSSQPHQHSMESAISHVRAGEVGRPHGIHNSASAAKPSNQSTREEVLANPRFAPLFLKLEEENLRLREALNAEKQRVLDLKVADQNRRQAWKHEMTKIELELVEKQALEERCARSDAEIERLKVWKIENDSSSEQRSLREILSLFVMHIQDPISAVRAACEELVPNAGHGCTPPCPRVPDPVKPGAQDGEYVERLMRIVEVLRYFAKARMEQREGQLRQGRQADLEDSRLLRSVSAGLLGGERLLGPLDNTMENVADWFLGEYDRGARGDGWMTNRTVQRRPEE